MHVSHSRLAGLLAICWVLKRVCPCLQPALMNNSPSTVQSTLFVFLDSFAWFGSSTTVKCSTVDGSGSRCFCCLAPCMMQHYKRSLHDCLPHSHENPLCMPVLAEAVCTDTSCTSPALLFIQGLQHATNCEHLQSGTRLCSIAPQLPGRACRGLPGASQGASYMVNVLPVAPRHGGRWHLLAVSFRNYEVQPEVSGRSRKARIKAEALFSNIAYLLAVLLFLGHVFNWLWCVCVCHLAVAMGIGMGCVPRFLPPMV
jgi:hypothetical protein